MSSNYRSNPTITVLIPTRDRANVLRYCLETVVAQTYSNFEVIVSDNFSLDETKMIVEEFRDPRIKYVNPGIRLSMSHNFEFALSHAATGWVTILGDDDGLLPDSLQRVASLIREHAVEAIRSATVNFQWPSYRRGAHGLLQIPLRKGQQIRHSKEWMMRVLQGKSFYSNLPILYTGGFVSTDVIDRIRAKGGDLIRSAIPDIYLGMAISSVTDKYLYSWDPLAVVGVSAHSTGASQFSAARNEPNSAAQRFLSDGERIPFHADLPLLPGGHYVPSIDVILFECFLQSMYLRLEDSNRLHANQLEVILSNATSERDVITKWAWQFANLHNLPYCEILQRAADPSLSKLLNAFYKTLDSLPSRRVEGDSGNPLKNIAEAALHSEACLREKVTIGESLNARVASTTQFLNSSVYYAKWKVKRWLRNFGYEVRNVRRRIDLDGLQHSLQRNGIDLVICVNEEPDDFSKSLRKLGFAGKVIDVVVSHSDFLNSGDNQSPENDPCRHFLAENTSFDDWLLCSIKGFDRPLLQFNSRRLESEILKPGADSWLHRMHGIVFRTPIFLANEGDSPWLKVFKRLEYERLSLWGVYPFCVDPLTSRMQLCDAVFFREVGDTPSQKTLYS